MSELQSVIWEMVEAGGRTAQSFGLNRLLGRIYMLLYLNEEPLCLDEISGELNVSKASASIACRQLLSFGAVQSVWPIGERKHYYEAETHFNKMFNDGFLTSLRKKIDSAGQQFNRSLEMIKAVDDDSLDSDFLKERIKQAEKYRSRLENLLTNPLLKRFL